MWVQASYYYSVNKSVWFKSISFQTYLVNDNDRNNNKNNNEKKITIIIKTKIIITIIIKTKIIMNKKIKTIIGIQTRWMVRDLLGDEGEVRFAAPRNWPIHVL